MLKKLLIGIILFISLTVILIFGLYFSHSFFTFTRPVQSDLLIIESWMSTFEIEHAVPLVNSDSINEVIIVGRIYPDDGNSIDSIFDKDLNFSKQSEEGNFVGIWLLTNASLVFNLMAIPVACELDDSLNIKVRAKGTHAGGYFAHFNLIVNGVFQSGAFTVAGDSVYSFVIKQPSDGLQHLVIRFDNDLIFQNLDRNLNIISVKAGDTEIQANDKNSLVVNSEGKYASGFNSQADERMNYLVHLGVYPEKIKSHSFYASERNQTISAAKSIRNSSLGREITSVNILSSGMHSGLIWFTYKRNLGNDIRVGIISK